MTRLRIAPALFILILFSAAHADQQQTQTVEYIQNWVAQIKGETPSPITEPGAPPIKCGTPAFLAASYYNRLYASPELAALLIRPSLPDTFGTEHFIIHYTTVGPDSVYHPHIDSLPGIPKYVSDVAGIFEHVWRFEIDTLGYRMPPADFGVGGDDRYDVYLENLGPGVYGYTTSDSIFFRNGVYVATSYIEIENDFYGFPRYETNPLLAAKITAAHEFFHAVQVSYDAEEFEDIGKPWWEEASSTWMENVVYPEIKDYLQYLFSFFQYPWVGLGSFINSYPLIFHPYASCIWPIYMTKRFNDLDLMRQIWTICGQVPGYNTFPATNTVLNDHGSNLAGAFLEFETWNFQTGPILADTVHYYTDGRLYPAADTTLFIADLASGPYSIPTTTHSPQQFATNYIVIDSTHVSGGIIADFDGQDLPPGQGWHVAILGYRTNDSRWVDIQVDPSSGNGAGAWPDWNIYRAVVLIPTVSGLTPNSSAFYYTGTLTYDPTLVVEGPSGFGISLAYPSPFNIADDNLLTISYSLNDFYSKSDMGLFIYDASGGLVRKIPGEYFLFTDPGLYHNGIQWDGKNSKGEYVSSGIYIILLRAGSNTSTDKIAVVNTR
jgi:hypothetical protein